MMIHALTQTELLAEIEARMRDPSNHRWVDGEIYRAINSAVRSWGQRVLIPFVYTPSDWDSSTREYTLPVYIHEPVDVYYRTFDIGEYWQEFDSYNLAPSNDGLLLTLSSFPYQAEARVIWWGRNSSVPLTVPTISGSTLTDSGTSVTVNAAVDVADSGLVKVEQEWIQYSGKTLGASSTTLNNLVRGVFDTTPASHNTTTPVNWGIAVHREDLYEQLYSQAIAYLHGLFLNDASTTEKEHHQFAMRYNQQRADEYWRKYTPARSPKIRLGKSAIGDVYGGYYRRLSEVWPWR